MIAFTGILKSARINRIKYAQSRLEKQENASTVYKHTKRTSKKDFEIWVETAIMFVWTCGRIVIHKFQTDEKQTELTE